MINVRARRRPRRGAIIILVTFCLLFLLIFAAFIINLAYVGLVDTELRSATDAATRAAAETLLRGGDVQDARAAAKLVAAANQVAGDGLSLRDEDIVFGYSESNAVGRGGFVVDSAEINAVKVTGDRQAGSTDGEIAMVFRGFLDTKTMSIKRHSVSRLIDRDFCLVLDRSGSMDTADAGAYQGFSNETPPEDAADVPAEQLTRMEALQIATQSFIDVLNESKGRELLGAASYSDQGVIDRELDFDYDQIVNKVNAYVPAGMTNIGAGIDNGVAVLLNANTRRVIAKPVLVVMTDGVHNQSRDPEIAARDAMLAIPNLVIHTVTFSNSADTARMSRVAAIGKGRHHHATNLSELNAVFEDIARTAGVTMVE